MRSSIIRTLSLTFLTLTVMFLLSACGPKAKSEEEIIADLQAHPNFFSAQEVAITDYEIIKRQTDSKSKSDIIYLTLNAGNEYIECNLSYKMQYNLYNDGWILDTVDEDRTSSWYITPLQGVSDADIQVLLDSYIQEGVFDSFEIVYHDDIVLKPNHGLDVVRLKATKVHLYAVETIFFEQTWLFDPEDSSFYNSTGFVEDYRYLSFNESFIGAEWSNLARHSGSYSLFIDRLDINITDLPNNHAIAADIIRNEVRYYAFGDPPSYVGSASVVLADLAYNPTKDKWGFSLGLLSGILYDENHSDNFDSSDYFYFDLDTPGVGGIESWYHVTPIDQTLLSIREQAAAAFANMES